MRPDAPPAMRCPTCGLDYPDTHRFCARDGATLLPDAPPDAAPPPVPDAGRTDDGSDLLADLTAYLGDAPDGDAAPPGVDVRPSPHPAAPTTEAPPVAWAPAPPAPWVPPARRSVPLPFVVIGALAVLALGVAAAAILSGNDAATDEVVPVADDLEDVIGDGEVFDEPADDMMMADTTMGDTTGGMMGAELSSRRLPGEPVAWRTARDDLRIGLSHGGVMVREADLALSASTHATGLSRVWLAGRDVVRFDVDDGTWVTTYYWEVEPNLVHYVGRNRATGEVNLSRRPATAAIVQAAEGVVPRRTFRTPSEREAEAALWRAGGRGTLVVAGLFDDPEDAKVRSEQLAAAGVTAYVAAADLYAGFDQGWTVVSLGPFGPDEAVRQLAAVRRVVPEASTREVHAP